MAIKLETESSPAKINYCPQVEVVTDMPFHAENRSLLDPQVVLPYYL